MAGRPRSLCAGCKSIRRRLNYAALIGAADSGRPASRLAASRADLATLADKARVQAGQFGPASRPAPGLVSRRLVCILPPARPSLIQ